MTNEEDTGFLFLGVNLFEEFLHLALFKEDVGSSKMISSERCAIARAISISWRVARSTSSILLSASRLSNPTSSSAAFADSSKDL